MTERHRALELSVQIESLASYTLVELAGELDSYNAPTLRKALGPLVVGRGLHIIIDLENLNFIDSHGLGVLIWCFKEVAKNGGSVRAVTSSEHMRRLLNVTGIDRVLSLFAGREDAIRAIESTRAAG